MIILKVKDVETSDDGLEMPEWMNNVHDLDSDDSDAWISLSAGETSSSWSDCSSVDEENEQPDESHNEDDEAEVDVSSDNAVSSLSDSTDDEVDEFDLFPPYHLPDNMDTSDDEETAMARSCWYWYLYEKGYVSSPFPMPANHAASSDAKTSDAESNSGSGENAKTPADASSKICDPPATDKSIATPNETTAEEASASMIVPLDAKN